MDAPASLPARLYLLAYDTRRQRLTARSRLGHVVRAGALADLLLDGRVTDDSGRPRTDGSGTPRPGAGLLGPDPVVDSMLKEIAASRPRRWQHWVRHDARSAQRAVRDQLEDGGWIRVEFRRPLGIFSRTVITLRDPRTVNRLVAEVTRSLHGGEPAARIPPRRAALVALAAAGELPTVFPRSVRRRHRNRIGQLEDCCGPITPALRRVIQQQRAAEGGV